MRVNQLQLIADMLRAQRDQYSPQTTEWRLLQAFASEFEREIDRAVECSLAVRHAHQRG